jgi:transposase InsO family protein
LADRSRRPHRSPARSSDPLEQAVIAVRVAHPAWGPRKIRRVLINQGQHDAASLPAPSTIGQILLRRGLIDPQESVKHQPLTRFQKDHPNELWQMDFKGHVPMLDGGRCHPLTLIDDHSRYVLCVRACSDEQTPTVRSSLIELFERYGQPAVILCDNGSPWGSAGSDEPHTLLSVWLMRHGIGVSHGRPRHPQTQGKDERMHRTMVDEMRLGRHGGGGGEPMRDLQQAQQRFDEFRHTYNHLRPHEALGMDCPISRYRPSVRSYDPDPLPPPPYRSGDVVRKVDSCGRISYRGRAWKIGRAFAAQQVAVRAPGSETTATTTVAAIDGTMTVFFGEHPIGMIDLRTNRPGEATLCSAPPPVAALPTAGHCTTDGSVAHVSEHLLPLTPV